MKVKELKEILEKVADEDNEVVVQVEEYRPLLSQGTPSVEIKFVARGIDWDSRCFILFPKIPLKVKEVKKE